jgi:hypothetical protein
MRWRMSALGGKADIDQPLPFAVKVHPLMALNAAPKPLTPSVEFDLRVITDAAAFLLGHAREIIARLKLARGTRRLAERPIGGAALGVTLCRGTSL